MTSTSLATSKKRQVAPEAATSKKELKKKRKVSKNVPKPGEAGYKTPTQLRNARKRRAKQQKQKNGGADEDKKQILDPSSQYLASPKSAPIVRKAKSYFQSLNYADFGIHVGPKMEGWRTVAKLAVRPDKEGGKVSIGLFAPNSHDLIPVPHCRAHHPSINAAVAALERTCHVLDVKAFDETTGTGHLRYVAMNVERATGGVQLSLVWNSAPYEEGDESADKNLLESFTKAIVGSSGSKRKRRRGRQGNDDAPKDAQEEKTPVPELQLHSLWVHFNASWKHSNAIFDITSGSWKHVYGPQCIEETLDGMSAPLQFPPNVFRQANLDAFTNIVKKIRSTIAKRYNDDKSKPSCLELYGGVGTIGLNICDLTSSLISSDENPFNKECFETAATKADLLDKVKYESKNATAMAHMVDDKQVIVVDPPRKGLDEEVMTAFVSSKTPEMLVYVSCGFEAFERDCNALLESGSWKLKYAEGHLLFPGSDAIETLAFFTRADKN